MNKWNKFTKTIFIGLLLLLLAIIGLFFTIEIYDPPKIRFITSNEQSYQAENHFSGLQCFRHEGQIPPIDQTTFRLLVWNLHKGQDQGWQLALKDFSQKRDLLFLQEVSDKQKLPSMFSSEFFTSLYVSAFSYLGQQSGVLQLAKFVPQLYCSGASIEPWIRIPKVGSAMIFPLANGQTLMAINLHLVNFELNPKHYSQQLATMMNLISHHQGPIILAGDFNAWNKKRLTLLKQLASEQGLQEVSYSPDVRLRFSNNPLDWVFVRGFQVNQATTIETTSSDHNPLLLELELITPPQ